MTWRWRGLALAGLLVASVAWSLRHSEPAAAAGCDGDIAYGERIDCTITNAIQVRDLTFSGNAGDVIRARVVATGGTLNPLTTVRFGGGAVCGPTFADEFSCTLTSTGTQTLRVDSNGSGNGSFVTTIQRLNDPSACPALPYGPTGKTGAINQQVEIDCFAHAGSVGQRWQVRVVETSPAPATLQFEVVRPNGTTVCGPTAATDASCLLDAAGTNRIFVYAAGGVQTANYRIVLEKFPTPTGCTAAAYGATNVVNVADPGAINCFTFGGAAGDVIRARMINSGGAWEPLTDILKPDGSTACGSTFADDQTCTLTTGGSHTLIVRDGGGLGERTGTGRLRLERFNDPSACPALPYGPTGKTGAINQQVEIDCFAHAGSVGQRWQVRVVETSPAPATLQFEVVRPNGTTVCGPTAATDASCLLDAAGTNRIFVYAAGGVQTANYRIVLEKFPTPTGCTAAAYGATNVVNVADPGAINCFTFGGAAGDVIRARMINSGGAWEPLTDILKPDGSTACGSTFADDQTCTLTTGGSHTLIVRDGGGLGERTGTGRLRLERFNDPSACPALPYGPTGKTGAINQQVEIDCFAHAGSVGQRWQVRVVETSPAPATLQFEVVRPNGTTVCGPTAATDTSCLLDAAGTNRIFVYAAGGVQTANYRIVLEKFPTPTGCTAAAYGATNVVNVADPGAINCFTFGGAAGDVIRARMINSGGAWEPLTDILKPDGSTACGSTFADDQTCTLTTGGSHTLIVRDGGGLGERTGTGRLRLERFNDPSACPALPYGPTGKTGAINQQVEIDCFAHAGSVGQRWQVRVVETSPAPATLQFEVVRPNGTTVCGPTAATDTSCLLDAAGTNRIFVYAAGGVQTANYRIVLEKFPTPTGCDLVDVGDPTQSRSVTAAGAIDCVRFTAPVGSDIRLQVINTAGAWEPLADVLRTDGSTECGSTFADDFVCHLTTGGSHTLIVRDGGGLGERTGTYSLRLSEP